MASKGIAESGEKESSEQILKGSTDEKTPDQQSNTGCDEEQNTLNQQQKEAELESWDFTIARLPGVNMPDTVFISGVKVSLEDIRQRLVKLHDNELALNVNKQEISVHLGKEFLHSISRTKRRFEELECSESEDSSVEMCSYTRRKIKKRKKKMLRKERKPRKILQKRAATHKPDLESGSSSSECEIESSSNSVSFSSASESTVYSFTMKKQRLRVSSSGSYESSSSELQELNGDFVFNEKRKLRRSSRNRRQIHLRDHAKVRCKIARCCMDDESESSEDDDQVNIDGTESVELFDSSIEL